MVTLNQNKSDPYREGRVKIVSFPENILLSFFNTWIGGQVVEILGPIAQGLPADTYLVSVNYNFEYRSWDVLVASEEFPIAPPGERVERIMSLWNVRALCVDEPSGEMPSNT